MKTKTVLNIVGARPNFIKMAPILEAMTNSQSLNPYLLHTGQHYDHNMSGAFFKHLNIPSPDFTLNCGGGSHSDQTARIMQGIDALLNKHPVDLILVAGDVNSTLAASLVAAKRHIPLAHVEAGLRSFDRTMPEEINRIITDRIADYLFTSCEESSSHLINEGCDPNRIFFVGNVMIDTLYKMLPHTQTSTIQQSLNIPNTYGLVTLHRPSNVDIPSTFVKILNALEHIQARIPLIWPMHPRTKHALINHNLLDHLTSLPQIICTPPLGYIDTLTLMKNASMVLTDSGGIQEESTVLGIPCITLRPNTERPITISQGTNILADPLSDTIVQTFDSHLKTTTTNTKCPPLWDGQTAQRIINILENATI